LEFRIHSSLGELLAGTRVIEVGEWEWLGAGVAEETEFGEGEFGSALEEDGRSVEVGRADGTRS
jgi:hypothetical protein